MKYLFLICLSLTIYSCKNEVEPTESFSKSWLLGEWTFLGSSDYRFGTLDEVLTNVNIGDSLIFEDAVLAEVTSTYGVLTKCKFKAEIISINTDSNYIEIESDNYPVNGKMKSTPIEYENISIKAKYYFEGKNKMRMEVFCDYYDKFFQRQITWWDSKYERNTR